MIFCADHNTITAIVTVSAQKPANLQKTDQEGNSAIFTFFTRQPQCVVTSNGFNLLSYFLHRLPSWRLAKHYQTILALVNFPNCFHHPNLPLVHPLPQFL